MFLGIVGECGDGRDVEGSRLGVGGGRRKVGGEVELCEMKGEWFNGRERFGSCMSSG